MYMHTYTIYNSSQNSTKHTASRELANWMADPCVRHPHVRGVVGKHTNKSTHTSKDSYTYHQNPVTYHCVSQLTLQTEGGRGGTKQLLQHVFLPCIPPGDDWLKTGTNYDACASTGTRFQSLTNFKVPLWKYYIGRWYICWIREKWGFEICIGW